MWITDPKTDKKSVSLTLLSISFSLYLTMLILQTIGYKVDAGLLTEIFYSCTALYFCRKIKIGGKDFNVEQSGN